MPNSGALRGPRRGQLALITPNFNTVATVCYSMLQLPSLSEELLAIIRLERYD